MTHGRLLSSLCLSLLVGLAAVAGAQTKLKVPQRVLDDLETARLAALKGDGSPAVGAIARLGSAGLTPAQREEVTYEYHLLGTRLLTRDVPGAALDVARALRRAASDVPVGVEAAQLECAALERLGDHAAALKVLLPLIDPGPRVPAQVQAALYGQRSELLLSTGKALAQSGRTAEGLQAILDAQTARGAWHWIHGGRTFRVALVDALIAHLSPTLHDRTVEGCEAVGDALALASLHERRDTSGRVVHCGLRVVDVLRSLAQVWERRQEPGLAKGLRAAAQAFKAPTRPYRLPPVSREDLAGFRIWRARVARERKAVPSLAQRAKRSDPAALFALGRLLLEGDVVPAERVRGEAMIQRAMALNHGPALLRRAGFANLGVGDLMVRALAAGERGALALLNDTPHPLSPGARAAARRLAEAGDARGWIVLARDTQQPAARHALLLRAARGGVVQSYQLLAELHAQGAAGGPANPAAAQFWRRCVALTQAEVSTRRWHDALKRDGAWRARLSAASRRYPAGAIELAWLELCQPKPRLDRALDAALRGIGTWRGRSVNGAEVERLPVLRIARTDRGQAARLIATITSRTDPEARHLLAHIQEAGLRGHARDSSRAFALHRVEARSQDRLACGAVQSQVLLAPGIAALQAELAWAKAAAAKGDAWAAAYAGQLLGSGQLGPPDRDAARAGYTLAAKRGSAAGHLGLVELESFLETIQGIPRAEVDRHLRAAATLGHTPAWVRLARRLEGRGDRKGAAAAWAKALAASNPTALLRAAGACFDRDDWKGGLKHVRRAAAAGSIAAYVRLLIVLHQNPKLREPNDP